MKKLLLAGLIALATLALAGTAAAKMTYVGKSKSGARLYVQDKVLKTDGACKTVVSGFMFQKATKIPQGMAKVVLRINKVCCDTKSFKTLAVRYIGTDRKVLHTQKYPESRAINYTPKPGTMGHNLVQKVCSPGFGAGAK